MITGQAGFDWLELRRDSPEFSFIMAGDVRLFQGLHSKVVIGVRQAAAIGFPCVCVCVRMRGHCGGVLRCAAVCAVT